MTGLWALCLTIILTACGDKTDMNGAVSAAMPFSPKGTKTRPLMESDVAAYTEDLRATVNQCNANFEDEKNGTDFSAP